MSIRTGDKAPSFTLPARPGETVDVGLHLGKEKLVLLFFPLAYSSVCTNELCHLRDDWSAWGHLDAAIYGISVDSPFVTDRFRTELGLPFPLLSDFNKDVSTMYGAIYDDFHGLKGVSKRAAFVIDADGMVVFDWVSEDGGQLPDFDAIRAAVEG